MDLAKIRGWNKGMKKIGICSTVQYLECEVEQFQVFVGLFFEFTSGHEPRTLHSAQTTLLRDGVRSNVSLGFTNKGDFNQLMLIR